MYSGINQNKSKEKVHHPWGWLPVTSWLAAVTMTNHRQNPINQNPRNQEDDEWGRLRREEEEEEEGV